MVKGTLIGEYEIKSDLGSGGTGAVYYAEERKLGRRAAIKVLSEALCPDAELVERFFEECRAVNRIRHPNIVEITDFGKHEQRHFITMELLEGESLGERLERSAPLPLEDAFTILRQIAAAVEAAHKQKIIHGDLKPENVFLSARDGQPVTVKVLDFGTRLFFQGDPVEDAERCVTGTLAYMAPEQLDPETTLDPRVDVYSLGVIAYEMLTGQKPFSAPSDRELIEAIQEAPYTSAVELNPELPPSVQVFFDSTISRDPEHRFNNMSGFLAGMEQVLNPIEFSLDSDFQDLDPSEVGQTLGPDKALNRDTNDRIGNRLGDIVLQRIHTDRLQLPAIPTAIGRAFSMLDQPGNSFGTIAQSLERDPIVAPQLLKVANSPVYLGARKAKTVEEAIRRLGFDELRVLLTELSTHKIFHSPNPRIRKAFRGLQQHSVAVAAVAREISRLVTPDRDHGIPYLAGLLSDLGRPIFAAMLLEAEKAVYRKHHDPSQVKWMTEGEWIRMVEESHAKVGVALARKWNLPFEVAQALKMERFDPVDNQSVPNIVRLAKAIVCQAGFEIGETSRQGVASEIDAGIKIMRLDDAATARIDSLLKMLPRPT